MAIARCFFGTINTNDDPNYFATPMFIYFHVYLMMICFANTFFFLATFRILHKGFARQKQNMEAQGKKEDLEVIWKRYKTQFIAIVRLSFLTGNSWKS